MKRIIYFFLPLTMAASLCACSANTGVPDQTSFVEQLNTVEEEVSVSINKIPVRVAEIMLNFPEEIREVVKEDVAQMKEASGKKMVEFGTEFEIKEGVTYIFDDDHKIRVEYLKFSKLVDEQGNEITNRGRFYHLELKTRYGDDVRNCTYRCNPSKNEYVRDSGKNPYKIKFLGIEEDGPNVTAKIIVEE